MILGYLWKGRADKNNILVEATLNATADTKLWSSKEYISYIYS